MIEINNKQFLDQTIGIPTRHFDVMKNAINQAHMLLQNYRLLYLAFYVNLFNTLDLDLIILVEDVNPVSCNV